MATQKEKYVMKYDVRHGDSSKMYELPQGAECPSEILEQMKRAKHVELYEERPPAPAPAAKVSTRIAQPKPAPDSAEEDGDVEPDKQ